MPEQNANKLKVMTIDLTGESRLRSFEDSLIQTVSNLNSVD